jgi:phage gp46-like protein
MPSVDDVFNQLLDANAKLDSIKGELLSEISSTDAVKASVDTVNATLAAGLGILVNQGAYTNAALYQNSLQNHTIICLLRQISEHTCGIWNESHVQTGLQTTIRDDEHELVTLYANTHADAALAWEQSEKLRKQIEECCPPEKEPPVCHDKEKCAEPKELPKPPKPPQRDVIK